MSMLLNAVRSAARNMSEADKRHRQIVSRLKSIERSLPVLLRDAGDAPEARMRILSLAKLLRPYAAVGHEKVRVGNKRDGGYVMIDDFKNVRQALSFGIGSNMSWDLDIAERGIFVHQFDHSIAAAPATHSNITFHQTKILSISNGEGETLESILADFAIDPKGDWILKIDIEDDEWAVFDATPIVALRRLRQILCEFHHFRLIATERQRYKRCLSVLQKLISLFAVVHVHANNHAPMMMIGGVPFPDVIEVTFASRQHYDLSISEEIFPTSLDFPNKETAQDYFLGRFVFD